MTKPINLLSFSYSRSEFGLLKNLYLEIIKNNNFNFKLIVGGSHLSNKQGLTVKEILYSKIKIYKKINIPLSNNTRKGLLDFLAKNTLEISKVLNKIKPDLILIMGDRYELLPIVNSALIFGIPVVHISGGEVTEGAIDDQIRHSVSKMSHIHFVANNSFKKRLLQIGEENWRIIVSGEPGIEKINEIKAISKKKLSSTLLNLDKTTVIVTFHPVTHEVENTKYYVNQLLLALSNFDFNIILTGSNADLYGSYVNKKFQEFSKNNKNCIYVQSLGYEKYHNVLKYVNLMIGNSSSGLVEAPSYGLMNINIGSRQKGRLSSKNTIHCDYKSTSIKKAIKNHIDKKYKGKNPYYKSNSSKIIINSMIKIFKKRSLEKIIKKKFIDL